LSFFQRKILETAVFNCPKCEETFPYEMKVDHMEKVHGEKIDLNCLPGCEEKFDCSENLKSHLLMACRFAGRR
jgi:hypothetical protein